MSLESWDSFKKHVQGGLREFNYLSGQNTLLCAGPPYLASIIKAIQSGDSKTVLFPIGLAQNFVLSQNTATQQLPEIGSVKTYAFRGRTVRQMSLGRVVYHGPSLLKVMYAWYNSGSSNIQSILPTWNGGVPPYLMPFADSGPTKTDNNVELTGALPSVRIPPGYDNLWLNLASDLFRVPTGMLVLFRDSEDNNVGALYLEQLQVPTHTLAVDSQGLIVQENAPFIVGDVIPIKLNAVKLVTGLPGQPEFLDANGVENKFDAF